MPKKKIDVLDIMKDADRTRKQVLKGTLCGFVFLALFMLAECVFSMNGPSIFAAFFAGFLTVFFNYQMKDFRVADNLAIIVLALIFSLGWTMGKVVDNRDFFQRFSSESLTICAVLLGAMSFFTAAILYFYKKSPFIWRFTSKSGIRTERFLAIVIIGTVVYSVSFYPGASFYDGFRQLYSYYGYSKWTNHDPAIATWLMGTLHRICSSIASDSLGFFLYNTVIQIVFIVLLWRMVKLLNRIAAPTWFCYAVAVYYAALPVIRLYSITLCKDTLFAMAVLWLITILIDIFQINREQKNTSIITYASLVFCLFLVMNFRNDGFYVVLLTVFALLINCKKRRERKKINVILIVCLVFHFSYGLMLNAAGIEKGSIREALSVPLQQNASYIKEYPDDISAQEREQLQTLFTVDINELGELYDPDISDPVKNTFIEHPTNKQLLGYFYIWFKLGMRHPAQYVKAYLRGYYGYFYPERVGSETGFHYYNLFDGPHKEKFKISYEVERSNLEHRATKAVFYSLLTYLSISSLIFCPGFYIWIMLYMFSMVVMKKKHMAITVFVPVISVLLIACLSPVNCRMRYVLPVVYALPLLSGFAFDIVSEKYNNSETIEDVI